MSTSSVSPFKIILTTTTSLSQVDGWVAELIGEPLVVEDALYPYLLFNIRISNKYAQARTIWNLSGDLYVGKEDTASNKVEFRYLTPMHVVSLRSSPSPAQSFQEGLLVLQPQGFAELQTIVNLSPVMLDRIEQVREGGDVLLAVRIKIWWQQKVSAVLVNHAGRSFIRIAKSDWVERILKKLGYMEVTVIELPEPVDVPELRKSIDYLRDAWKRYRIGEYYDAVTNVRRALDSLIESLRNYYPDLIVEREENNRKIREPNFKALASTDTEAESVAKIYRGLKSLGGLSAHEGAAYVDKQVAELSIIVGQALLRYVTRRIKTAKKIDPTS